MALVEGDATLTRNALLDDLGGLRRLVPRGATVLLVTQRPSSVLRALLHLDGWAGEVHVVSGTGDVDAPGVDVVLTDGAADDGAFDDGRLHASSGSSIDPAGGAAHPVPDAAGPTRWVLYTSGTTGQPRSVEHTMATLSRTVRPRGPGAVLVWGMAYEPTRMAGIQVLLQAWESGSPIVALPSSLTVRDRVELMVRHDVQALSATPTMWRQILQTPAAESLSLQQITLGGEIADQAVLDALHRAFPHARITHIFASTETGAAFSVSDGKAGFPARYLQFPPRGVDLQVRDGLLFVHSPGVSTAGADGFAPTEDLVELVGERLLFKGRQSGVVNVGGVKVWPEQVEQVLRSHDGVQDAVVFSKRNALSGFVLVAEVVPAAGTDVEDLPKLLRALCRERLQPAQVPAVIRLVPVLRTTSAGKAVRT